MSYGALKHVAVQAFLINKSETPYDKRADLVIHESIGRVLSETVKFK